MASKSARRPIREDEVADAVAEQGHGGEEDRSSFLCPVPDDLPDGERRKNLKAIGIAIHQTVRNGKASSEVRYDILSRSVSGKRFAEAVRTHWSIENRLHWPLDMTFSEDQCRIRKGHADANFSILRRTALSLLKNEKTAKVGMKNKRLNAGWDDGDLEKVLMGTCTDSAARMHSGFSHSNSFLRFETCGISANSIFLMRRSSQKDRVGSLIVCHRPTPDSAFSAFNGNTVHICARHSLPVTWVW